MASPAAAPMTRSARPVPDALPMPHPAAVLASQSGTRIRQTRVLRRRKLPHGVAVTGPLCRPGRSSLHGARPLRISPS